MREEGREAGREGRKFRIEGSGAKNLLVRK